MFFRQIKGFKGFYAKYRFLKVLRVPLGGLILKTHGVLRILNISDHTDEPFCSKATCIFSPFL